MYDIIIIGGGAAGSFAALQAGYMNKKTLIIEQNGYIGKKLKITGKGRCNLTNNCSLDELMQNIPRNSRFLFSAFSRITPQNVMSIFETLGVPLKTERGKRVFPVSDKAIDIVNALSGELRRLNVDLQTKKVTELIIEEKTCVGVKCGEHEYFGKKIILATGGLSYPQTGSDGSGYKLAKNVGHTITPLSPSLVGLECNESFCNDLMGLSLKNVKLSITTLSNRRIFVDLGELLFTHYGIDGPLVLSCSAHLDEKLMSKYKISIDLKPGLTIEQLDKRIKRDFEKYLNKDFRNALSELLPSKMIDVIIKLSEIPPDKKVNSITKEERRHLVETMKNMKLTVKNFHSVNSAVITRGGIKVQEINPKLMESKLIKNLFFAGEIIDVDGYTGGFNLQIAFATGYIAAIS